MTTLIGHGYVGTAIAKELELQNIAFAHCHHDNWSEPDPKGLVVNAAGYLGFPNIDACEINRRETIEGNILWPLSINRAAIHVTTGCIYEGNNDGHGWSENDEPNFCKSFYSLTKSIAEKQLLSRKPFQSYIIRIRQPFGSISHSRNLLTKLNSYPKLMNVVNSMSCIEDVAKVIAFFIKERPPYGIYNLTNPGSISVKEIADIMNIRKEWFSPEEFAVACPSPRSNCVLNVDKITTLFPLRNIHQAIEQCVRNYA